LEIKKDKDASTQTDWEKMTVERVIREFGQLAEQRSITAAHWQEVSELILPTARNTFYYGSYNPPGEKKTQKQIDASGMMALERFSAIMDSLLTPRNMYWHGLADSDEYMMKQRNVALWYEQATKVLFKLRYSPMANFASQNVSGWQQLGAFGNTGMFIDELDDPEGKTIGVRYREVPMGELFYRQNHQGIVDGFVRWFRMTARNAQQKWPDAFPAVLRGALDKGSGQMFDFLHYVSPNEEWDRHSLLPQKRFPWVSHYVSMEGRVLLSTKGYYTFPLPISRYVQTPGEVYGRGPAMFILPALKTLNAEKTTFLKQGHRAADPVLMTTDDGLVDFNLRPGALNAGGVTSDGRPLVHVLPTGEIQISKEMMAEEKSLINDAFLVTLFQIMTETPTMTATEVIERTNEKGILLAPTAGRQQSERLGPMIHRELDIAARLRLLPPLPPEMRERGSVSYDVVYTSPISRAMRAQEAAGFMRTVETAKEIVNITQDPSYLFPFNFDVAIPAIAEIQAVPPSWMSTPEQIAAKKKALQASQDRQAQIQAMPAQAAMIKAQASVAKNQPGVANGQQAFGGPQPAGA
jgi:hypothetical protein